ncbi:hypothetical protein [Nonomuraea sp. CA-141351]|uniref:hypothetical protein n=1 Tax=Nonomuraea sp. CA-141351 TaxID=3239996 RepID=UPI003D90D290
MGTEAFYTTAAQVLPTILIALTVELGFFIQSEQAYVSRLREAEGSAPDWRGDPGLTSLFRATLGLGATFLVGEAAALLAIAFRWFNGWTFFLIAFSLLIMMVGAIVVPILRHANASQR